MTGRTLWVCFFILAGQVQAVNLNLDSLYSRYLGLHGLKAHAARAMDTEGPMKCGFSISGAIRENMDKFSLEKQAVLQKLMARPALDSSVVSPKGHFRIHFSKPGTQDAPKYSPTDLALIADSVYDYEIGSLGFPPPPTDSLEGGDGLYDIYMENLNYTSYGWTEFESSLPKNRYTSYIVLSSDYSSGYRTKGLDAARVTLAHEFNHAIQMGCYIYRDEDLYYYEMTSTAMEAFTFPRIHDYYGYIPYYFSNISKDFGASDGNLEYGKALWNIYLKEKMGFPLIKKIWELMPEMRALKAMSKAISDAGSDFTSEFGTYSTWLYFTSDRAVPGMYFADADKYKAKVRPVYSGVFSSPETSLNFNLNPVSSNFIELNTASGDSLCIVYASSDIASEMDLQGYTLAVDLSVAKTQRSGYISVGGSYSYKITGPNGCYFSSAILNNQASFPPPEERFAYPQPFVMGRNDYLFIPIQAGFEDRVEAAIYGPSMRRIMLPDGSATVISGRKPVVRIDLRNAMIPSGVYFYVLRSASGLTQKGKIAILH